MVVFPRIVFNKSFTLGYEDSFVKQIINIQQKQKDIVLEKEYVSNENAVILREKHLSDLIAFLKKEGVLAIPLKGLYLTKTLFKDYSGLRSMADIDVLVKKEDFSKTKKLLTSFGEIRPFKKGAACYAKIYHEYSVLYGGSTIEIHRGQSVFDLFKMRYGDFFKEGRSVVDNYGVEISYPSIEMMIIFYLVHDLSDGLSSLQPLSYEKMTRFFVMLHNADREKVLLLAQRYGVSRLFELYDHILEIVFEGHTTKSERKPFWYSLILSTGKQAMPLAFRWGDIFFKLLIFKGNIIKKLFPKIFCFFVDLFFRW